MGLLRWRHVINTHSSWLHGSELGFRSRKHRIHSSGDYNNPPPPGEHSGLFRYQQARSSSRVEIPEQFRGPIGVELIRFFAERKHALGAMAVMDLHAHFLVELSESLPAVKAIVGSAKEKVSRLINKQIAGFRWAAGGTFKVVNGQTHLSTSIEYILTKQGPGAWTWCPHCGEPSAERRCPFIHR
jgi:hypothetical protein